MSAKFVSPTDVHYCLNINSKGVFLSTGEPLSHEEAVVLREAIERYLAELASYPTSPAISIAYDRFTHWAAKTIPPDGSEKAIGEIGDYDDAETKSIQSSGPFDEYEGLKINRERRISHCQAWAIQFYTPEEREKTLKVWHLLGRIGDE